MKINRIRIIFTLLALLIYASHASSHFFYLAPMWISLEILNQNHRFLRWQIFETVNIVFVVYTIAVIVNRSRDARFGISTEAIINIGEHFFYAIFIGLKMAVYLRIIGLKLTNKMILWVAISLNIIGFFNELLQNLICGRFVFHFIADAKKDMFVNLAGTLVFVLSALLYSHWMKTRNGLRIA